MPARRAIGAYVNCLSSSNDRVWQTLVVSGVKRPRDQICRTGVAIVLVLLGSVAAALALARFYHLGVPGTVVALMVGGGSLAGLVLAWVAYRDDHRDADRIASLAEAADQLAAWVRVQWEGEAAVRPGGGTVIEAMLRDGLILPILDRLDEIPDPVRASALTQINDALRPGEKLVVTCHTEQYRIGHPAVRGRRDRRAGSSGSSVVPAGCRHCLPLPA
jgi:hypothetical protein